MRTIDALAEMLADAAPDVVLIDSSGEPFEPMLESILASGLASDVSVVILGDGMTPAASADALRAGIRAALPGDISPDQLVAALQAVASGLIVLHPSHMPMKGSRRDRRRRARSRRACRILDAPGTGSSADARRRTEQ